MFAYSKHVYNYSVLDLILNEILHCKDARKTTQHSTNICIFCISNTEIKTIITDDKCKKRFFSFHAVNTLIAKTIGHFLFKKRGCGGQN